MSEAKHAWKDYQGKDPIWCPGCGDFGVLRALQQAAAGLDLDPASTVLSTGIGCSGNITAYFRTYGFHGIHGRSLPAATGIKLTNPELTVLAAGGDGDGFGIGLGHFMHAARRNVDITYVVMDNQVYGLTKGQTSPTTSAAMSTKASPLGPMAEPVHPLELAMAAGASFVAQGFAGDQKGLVDLIQRGIRHRGFSLINVQSPCVTYNQLNTYAWFKEHIVDLAAEGHDPHDRMAAITMAHERNRVPVGVLFEERRATLEDHMRWKPPMDVPGPVAAAGHPARALHSAGERFDAWLDAFRVR